MFAFQINERLTHCIKFVRKPNERAQRGLLIPTHVYAAERCRQCGCEYVISVEHRGAHLMHRNLQVNTSGKINFHFSPASEHDMRLLIPPQQNAFQ
jgi:hypothetical protein